MRPEGQRRVARRDRLGGTDGNEVLTSTTGVLLTLLLLAEGVTILRMNGLVSVHMLIGLALVPPILLKLASTGYRFARYYAGSRAYRAKGPPQMWLRALAPVLVVATIAVFTSGVVLLADGHKAGALLEIHKVSFIVWGAVFGVHFLAYAPGVARSVPGYWRATDRPRGAGLRGAAIAAAAGAGVALAAVVYPAVTNWRP